MIEEIIAHLIQNPSEVRAWKLQINGLNYEIQVESKRRFNIALKPSQFIMISRDDFEIRKSIIGSIIARYPQYSIKGKITALSDKVLSNKFTPVLLNFPASRIRGKNDQISFTVKLKKKRIHDLNEIIQYFEALLNTLKNIPLQA